MKVRTLLCAALLALSPAAQANAPRAASPFVIVKARASRQPSPSLRSARPPAEQARMCR